MVESKFGRAYMEIRVRKPGHYTRGHKVNVLMAIEPGYPYLSPHASGSIANPRQWLLLAENTDMTALVYADFIDSICVDLESNLANGDLDDERCFIWDNLTAYLAPIVAQVVEGRPPPNVFSTVPRPPYQPKYGPIEYIFRELLSAELSHRVQPDWTFEIIKQEIRNVPAMLGRDGKFNNTFAHCGYAV
jgi:transposase